MWMAYATAFALGIAHALEVDHMVAVSAFIGNRPNLRSAVSFGVLWGMGHSLVVLIVGAALILSGVSVPESVTGWAELGVGAMLVLLGIWAAGASRRLHLHTPHDHEGHAHLHAHSPEQHPHSHEHGAPDRRHRHLSTIVGAVHGLAGTAPVVALIPVTLMPTTWGAIGYLAAFALGTVLGMGAFSGLAAVAVGRAASSATLARAVAIGTAAASMAVGTLWIVRAMGDLAG